MGVHGCRLYYPVRHPVARTEAFQLRMKDTATQARPDWIALGCKHANPQMFKEGMPEMQPIPDDVDFGLRAGRDRMRYPISVRDDRCIVLESKRHQARCTLSEMQRYAFKNMHPNTSPQLPMALHEKFVENIKAKPDETRSVFRSIAYEAKLYGVLAKFFPKVQARIDEMFTRNTIEDTQMMHDCLKSIAKKLPCRNSNIVMFNPTLTSLTGSNTAAYFLGMLEQARGALFYLVKYLTKDKTELSACLVTLLDARKHISNYPSVAENTGTESRTSQHFLLRVLNSLSGMSEFGAQQAASVVMERPCTWISHEFTYIFPYELLDWLSQRRDKPTRFSYDWNSSVVEQRDRSRVTARVAQASNAFSQANPASQTAARHTSSPSMGSSAVTQTSPRGLGTDYGDIAWLNLEQVAGIIQYHNNAESADRRIVTTIFQGVEREHWKTIWINMQMEESGEICENERVRSFLKTYGQTLAQHKRAEISGIYPMKSGGHWRMYIVSYILQEVLLFDPLGEGFTSEEKSNIQAAYVGFTVNVWKQCLQSDEWNCGVWVAWLGTFWTKHVASGFEGCSSIGEVIQEGLTLQGIEDIKVHPNAIAHNEAVILGMRRCFRSVIYSQTHPVCLTDWLEQWHTPLSDIQLVSSVTSLRPVSNSSGTHSSGLIDLTEDSTNTAGSDQFNVPSESFAPRSLANGMPRGDDGQPENNQDSGANAQHESVLEEIINDTPCGSAPVYWVDGQPIAVSPGQHFLLRNASLRFMSLVEFSLCTQVVQKKKAQEEPANADAQTEEQPHLNASRNRGRPSNMRMSFASEFHPLFHTHELQLRSKINPFILGGNPPPRPPPLPKPENPTEAWIKKANVFAAYYLVLFRPFNEDDVDSMSFSWDALCNFMQQIDQVIKKNMGSKSTNNVNINKKDN